MRRPATRRDDSPVHETGGYSVRVSDEPDDPAWDDFLEEAPGSAYTQTSCWGRARASIGWRPIRVVVRENGRIVGGAQMERRALPAGGDAGLVYRGPVIRADCPDVVRLVLDEMMAMGRSSNVQYLAVQPPRDGDAMQGELTRLGFRHGLLDVTYMYSPAAVCVDLRADLDELLAEMSASRRRNVRLAEKGDAVVRRGSEADLPIFNRLKDAHSTRIGYPRREGAYYVELWRALTPRKHIELFIAEYEGEPVCASLVLAFGNTTHHIERPWSGEHAELRATELVEWEAFKWAKAEGYLFADVGGIEGPAAEAALSGKPDSVDPSYGASIFKLRWGGQVVANPPFLDYVYNPVLRFGYRCIPENVMRSAWMEGLVKRLRGTGA